ncbi:MAG TPA: DUF1080 domain-containing protein [Flavisolibacter sp.]|nr:DUF1080 domain-containing protein [Flavisolibacter sp.]
MESANNGAANDDKEWISLFDGKTTTGWHTYGKTTIGKAWKVEDNALRLDAASKKEWQTAEGGDIISDEEFDNFHLKLDWKISPKGNSGIIFFINEDPKYQYPWQTGPEMQVLDNGSPTQPGHDDAKLYTHRAGDLYDLLASKDAVKPAGEWNTVEIVANKGKLDFYMNGQHTLSTTMWDDNWKQMVAISKFKAMPGFGAFQKGRIGLQDHGNDVWFRNIKIKRL